MYDVRRRTNIKIVTTSWRAPVEAAMFLRVGISRMPPRQLRGYRTYAPLYPGRWWREISGAAEWASRYLEDLDRLDPGKVLDDLAAMVRDGRGIALCCWEAPPPSAEWCHRGLVSSWLHSRLDFAVPELGHEDSGCGRCHPMLHASMRSA